MTSKHIEELLQQCIAAFDSGISPEECLGMFPAQRAELEPLFRQAISLRVAFAAAPRARPTGRKSVTAQRPLPVLHSVRRMLVSGR